MARNFPKTRTDDIVRLGLELQARGFTVWEHPAFGGVKASAHIPNSKHLRAEAIDANRDPRGRPTSHSEDIAFDALSVELAVRGFGVIWNRGNYPGDHATHCHAETAGNPQQYPGRIRLKSGARQPTARGVDLMGTYVVADGVLGPKTITRLQYWAGTYPDGILDEKGSGFVKALQRYLNTQQRGTLTVDGALGRRTITALQSELGTPVDGVLSPRSAAVKRLQQRLNARGNIAHSARG